MLARLAWRNLLLRRGPSRALHYPFFVIVMVSVAACYAFSTIDAQVSLLEGGDVLPRGFEGAMGRAAMVASVAVCLTMMVEYRCVAVLRRDELDTLRLLGLSYGDVCLMLWCEDSVVLLVGVAVGLLAGVLFSHVLVFVTAAMLSARVVGFGLFLSPAALGTTAGALAPIAATMLLSTLVVVPRRRYRGGGQMRARREVRGPRWAAVACVLIAGLAAVVSSCSLLEWPCVEVLRDAGGQLVEGARGTPWAIALLSLGTVGLIWAMGEALPALGRCWERHRGSVVSSLTCAQVGGLMSSYAYELTFSTVCLTLVGYQLAGALGSRMDPQTPLDLPAMAYLGSFLSFMLLVCASTTLSSVVGLHVQLSGGEYLTLHDLGLSRQAVWRLQRRRIMLGFGVPIALSLAYLLAFLSRRGIQTTPYGMAWSPAGVALAALMCGTVLLAYAMTSTVSVRNSLRSEFVRARQLG